MNIIERLPDGVKFTEYAGQTITPGAYASAANSVISAQDAADALAEISSWQHYQATPLISLTKLSNHLDCGMIAYKDESKRFGLGSFKALGGAYAVLCLVAREYKQAKGSDIGLADIRKGLHKDFSSKMMVTTATDGNHGRSVAWGAKNAGCQCRIYIHREVSEGRKLAMEAYGANVIRIDGDYDESVRQCAIESADNGWFVVSDTSYENYMRVPRDVMAGYTVIASEVKQQIEKPLTHVVIQAGVGGLAAAVCAGLWMDTGADRPQIIVVETEHADCWLKSIKARKPTPVSISVETVMAGLSCGEVSQLAWDVLSLCIDAVVTLADDQVPAAMRLFADGEMAKEKIEAGECAVPGALALMAVCADKTLKAKLGIDATSHVLLLGCEGATDPEIYQRLLASTEQTVQ